MIFVSVTERQKNFSKYLKLIEQGEEVILLEDGKRVARLLPEKKSVSFLTDSLIGVLKGEDCDVKSIRVQRLEKYDKID